MDIENEKTTCNNCGASYDIIHDLPEEDYIEKFCPFCGHENEDNDEITHVENRYEDWN
jgi:hydrogenase maturation factor HypF (carbamoyltransferase family)